MANLGYELLGSSLALALFLTLNVAGAALATLLWRGLRPYVSSWPAVKQARWLFALRVLPTVLALFCIAGLVVPSYVTYEKRDTDEPVRWLLALFAGLSLAGIIYALSRVVTSWLATRRLLADWQRHSAPIRVWDKTLPAFRFRHPFPVIAVVGVFRPRLFVAEQLFTALSETELAAALAHESGHLAARDNLKRMLLRVCRDLLSVLPVGRTLDAAWYEASENAADEYAAGNDQQTALDLATVLVKIARLAPTGIKLAVPVHASLINEHSEILGGRVQRLLQLAGENTPCPPKSSHLTLLGWASLLALTSLALWVASCQPWGLEIHNILEWLVSSQP
ncbi:MAG: M56 family metallopeptidase [Acidobacteria bacterium]|nr:M56 family metallopeptidase [Acidobacteriota bacterium]